MPVYETTLDPADEGTSHGLMLRLVGGNKSVLDVGCATGYLARALVARGCTVSGVEMVPEAAEQARPVLERLVIGDLATLDLEAELDGARFDAVVLGDVLEHLVDPDALLRQVVRLLAPGGSVVISVPNVTHGSLRLALLQGRWQYRDRGLLDSTHVRFFTRESLLRTVREAGLVAAEVVPTRADALGVEVEVDAGALPPGVVDWVRAQPDADAYQFVVRAVRDDADGAWARAGAEHEALTRRLAAAEAERDALRRERDEARGALDVVTGTRAWRALGPVRRVYGALRRRVGGAR